MRFIFERAITLCLAAVLTWPAVYPQAGLDVTTDPAQVKFYYDDLHNFLEAFRKINEGADLKQTLKTEYLDKASPGLKNFLQDKEYGLDDFVSRFEKNKQSYATLTEAPKQLAGQEASIRMALTGMKKVLPDSAFLPIYYIVGLGSGMFAEPSEVGIRMAMTRLADPDHLSRLKLTVVHETVHIQQYMAIGPEEYHRIYEDKQSLLAVSIREGVAEFLTSLITGEFSKKEVHDYIKKDEKRIWERFQAEMNNREFGDWLFAAPKDPNQPRDLGYIMGALIVESYYENASDKKKALAEILKITDYQAFLAKSRYADKF